MNLNIDQHTNTLLRWIASCENQEQLNLCREALQHFIMDRFKHYVDNSILYLAYDILIKAIDERHMQVHGVGLDELN